MPDLQTLWLILRTLAIGLAGAFLFHLAGLPAAFMSGALVFVAIASLSGIRVQMPVQVRNVAFYLAGTFFGTTVTEETVSSLMAWPFSIAALACSLVLIMTVIPKYLEKVHGYDRETAILSSVPGVLSFVLALALDRGADVRRITIVQTCRLAGLIVLLPLVFGLFNEIKPLGATDQDPLSWAEIAVIYAAAGASIFLAARLNIPAPFFSGPFFAIGTLFGLGIFHGAMPVYLFWPALAGLGTVIGTRFAGIDLKMLASGALAGLGSTAIGLAIAGGLAIPMSYWLDLPFLQLLLAFAPGGIDALTVVAFSLGADPAFVAGHQMLRFIGLSLCLPFAAKWFGFDTPQG